jgi:hypothetical protein
MARIWCPSPDAVPAGAVWVGEGTLWANPHRAGDVLPSGAVVTPQTARALFAVHLAACPELAEDVRALLAGQDVACSCEPGTPCHGEVLDRLANGAAAALPVGSVR